MRYISTRGQAEEASAATTIITGLAPDGGLYIPAEKLPRFDLAQLAGKKYADLAYLLTRPFLSGYPAEELQSSLQAAYSADNFSDPAITPLKQLTPELFVLELFHGPTSAFKDIALQLLPHLLSAAIDLSAEKSEVVILAATSGDTGKSALEGFKDVPGTRIVVYFPHGGVSLIQERQMTTQEGKNVFVAAVTGNFDQAQSGVKAIFNDVSLAAELNGKRFRLSSANSINWGRLLPQVVYYYAAYLELLQQKKIVPGEKINFIVPTGNFGNILAGWYALKTGLPINRLILAANSNNVLADFVSHGCYDSRRKLLKTSSPSMDILVSSNLERLLFELNGRNHHKLAAWMNELQEEGFYRTDPETLENIKKVIWSGYADDGKTAATIKDSYLQLGYLFDTHTAVGKSVYDSYLCQEEDKTKSVLLATASPFKFNHSVAEALFGKPFLAGKSEFELLDLLSKETGLKVPANLSGLEEKMVIHDRVISPDKMQSHLLSALF